MYYVRVSPSITTHSSSCSSVSRLGGWSGGSGREDSSVVSSVVVNTTAAAAAGFCFLCDLDLTSVNGASVSADCLSASGLVDVERAVCKRERRADANECNCDSYTKDPINPWLH
jgi:hypothetical protein